MTIDLPRNVRMEITAPRGRLTLVNPFQYKRVNTLGKVSSTKEFNTCTRIFLKWEIYSLQIRAIRLFMKQHRGE